MPQDGLSWQVDTQMISDGLRADRKASLSTANSAPTEHPFSGDGKVLFQTPESWNVLHAATVNSGQLNQKSKGMACLHGKC